MDSSSEPAAAQAPLMRVFWRTLRWPLAVLGACLLCWAAVDGLLFRSGFYYQAVAEPNSNAGLTAMRVEHVRRLATATPPTVLVFGDSRTGEGFSPRVAEAHAAELRFINVAVAGSTARTWFYLLREIEREQLPFAAVVVGIPYELGGGGDWADWPLDPLFMAPLLDLGDLRSFPAGFTSPGMRRRARETILLPGLTMQKDVQALLAAPRARQRALRGKVWWHENIDAYAGRDARMPALDVAADGTVTDWGAADPEQRAAIEQHARELAGGPDAGNDAFLATWLGRLLELARARGAAVVIYPHPRGPYAPLLPARFSLPAALRQLDAEPDVQVLPPDFFADLERPEYFFDTLHPNAAGREQISARIGALLAARQGARRAQTGAAP